MLHVLRKPLWASVMSEEDPRSQTRQSFIILSIVLQTQLVNAGDFGDDQTSLPDTMD